MSRKLKSIIQFSFYIGSIVLILYLAEENKPRFFDELINKALPIALLIGIIFAIYFTFIAIRYIFVLIHRLKLWHWKTHDEKKYSLTKKDYPIDWEMRCAEIYLRDEKKCKNCKRLVVNNKLKKYNAKNIEGEKAHIHHIIPLSKGGNSELINLELLCVNCHQNIHPDIDFNRKKY
jgi:hypothetical protein